MILNIELKRHLFYAFESICKELGTNPYSYIRDFVKSEVEKAEIRQCLKILKKEKVIS